MKINPIPAIFDKLRKFPFSIKTFTQKKVSNKKLSSDLDIAKYKIASQDEEKKLAELEFNITLLALKKAEGFIEQYITGLENMLVMTSHGVRQPIANILGILQLLDKSVASPQEMTKLMAFMKQSVLALDVFTKKLTVYICNLVEKENERIHLH